MKIKEVIAQTDLTDRAIRLYIENGLVSPSFNENYKGRKNIDFSQEDVENLKNIATLRKAGFSIAEIKLIKDGGDECRRTLSEFITKTAERIEADKEIINSLQSVVKEDDLSIEAICNSLNTPTAKKSVPKEDMKLPKDEIFKRRFFLVLGVLGLFFWILDAYLQNMIYIEEYRFLKIENYEIFAFRTIICILSLIAPILLIFTNRHTKTIKTTKRRRFRNTTVSVVLLSIFLFSGFINLLNVTFSIRVPNFCSMTSDPSNYLELDKYVKNYSEDIYSIFPAKIPPTAFFQDYSSEEDPVKYYYRFSNDLSTRIDIMAEWDLPDDKYEEHKKRGLETDKIVTLKKQKGEWSCLYFQDCTDEAKKDYYYLIFAYNDNTNSLRYILSYYRTYNEAAEKSFYTDLEW